MSKAPVNLLEETVDKLRRNGYTVEDIEAVQSDTIRISVPKFVELARQTNYDNGYGSQMVANDLKLLMKDGSYFVRREYDGSEWWDHVPLIKPFSKIDDDKVTKLFHKWGGNLEWINNPKKRC